MSSIDFALVNDALDAETVVPQWFPGGKRTGREYVALNPMRTDRSAGSLSVNLKTGKWADFASGDAGGDLVSLYAYRYHRGDQVAAARELAETYGVRTDADARQAYAEREKVAKIEDVKPVPVFPVPVGAGEPEFKHFKFGQPTSIHLYRDDNARPLIYVVRFDPPNMRKQVVPLSWCKHANGVERWTWAGIRTGKVPLYGLELLAERPDADVLVVEGEKAADAARAFMGDFVVVTWLGGMQRAPKVALKALHGRRVTFWPDFDAHRVPLTDDEKAAGVDPQSKPIKPLHEQGGMQAMMAIAEDLKGKSQLSLVGYTPGEYEHGFDLADGWDESSAVAYMRENGGDPWDVITGRKTKTVAETPPDRVPLTNPVNLYGFPHQNAKYQPLNTRENLAFLMDEYGITARYNEVKKSVELHFPSREFFGDTRQENALVELSSLCSMNQLPKGDLSAYVKNIACDNVYSPVREWIDSKPWDGKPRIPALLATLETAPENKELKDALVYRWLISAVAAAYRPPDFEAHGVLVFTGEQGKGKTAWFRRLAPSAMGVILVGASVDPSDKDSVTRVVSHWIVELGELDGTFRKADIARLKAFATAPVDKLRRPYDRLESEYKRTTVLGASVNQGRYLVDDTGNRRWWTVSVTAIDYMHTIDMQQLWAEVLTHFKRGVQWWLTDDEVKALNALNESHEEVDPVREKILRAFDFEGGATLINEMTASEVLHYVGYENTNNRQATHAAKLLRELCGTDARRTKTGRLFPMPRKLNRNEPMQTIF